MTRDDLAKAIYHAGDGLDWTRTDQITKERCLKRADAAAKALGVALDPETDPRYEAAMKELLDKELPWARANADSISRAIVSAIDVDKGR